MNSPAYRSAPLKVVRNIAFAAIFLAGLSSLGVAQTPANQIAERVLIALRAASEARSENARETQDWKEERQRLNVLQQTLNQRIDQQRIRAKMLRQEVSQLKKKNQELEPQRVTIKRLEDLAQAKAALINQKLDALSLTLPPGVVPKTPEPVSQAIENLQNALGRLEATENNLTNVAVELTTGNLSGKPLAVELLRVGGAMTWWRSLDAQQAGHAHMVDGKLTLTRVDSASDRKAIIKACEIAKGRAAPQMLALPFASTGKDK